MNLDYINRDLLSDLEFKRWQPLIEARNQQKFSDGFNYSVEIKHLDGSYFKLTHAFLVEGPKQIMVFTEHCGYLSFFKEDLESFNETHINGK